MACAAASSVRSLWTSASCRLCSAATHSVISRSSVRRAALPGRSSSILTIRSRRTKPSFSSATHRSRSSAMRASLFLMVSLDRIVLGVSAAEEPALLKTNDSSESEHSGLSFVPPLPCGSGGGGGSSSCTCSWPFKRAAALEQRSVSGACAASCAKDASWRLARVAAASEEVLDTWLHAAAADLSMSLPGLEEAAPPSGWPLLAPSGAAGGS
mmetsp:Transcript_107720/g.300164  ORF Transcript_107720/g.300164 Transcript_107720/m.300164 type:complete len:212 (-) Transcript_107720:167-802(-)